MMSAVLSNPNHPEYGVATIPFPIPHDQYTYCMEMLEALEIGDALKADCKVEKIDSFYSVLKRTEMLTVNTLNVIDAMSYQEWQYQTSRGISATLALGPGRALILADLPDSFVTITILAGSTDGLTRGLLEELADSFDLSKLTPIVLPESLYIPSP